MPNICRGWRDHCHRNRKRREAFAGARRWLDIIERGAGTTSLADWQGTTLPIDAHPAYGDLEHRTLNHSFFGCYVGYQPDAWTYDRQTFYVDVATGFSVLITSHFEQE